MYLILQNKFHGTEGRLRVREGRVSVRQWELLDRRLCGARGTSNCSCPGLSVSPGQQWARVGEDGVLEGC